MIVMIHWRNQCESIVCSRCDRTQVVAGTRQSFLVDCDGTQIEAGTTQMILRLQ